ncbi:MAG: ribonuclease III [Bacilli bacterium]|jgi:ribonuclease III
MKSIDEFFKRFNIVPKNRDLYLMAFTHSSFNSDANTHHHDYERLEFMGDSVLGFVVASLIYKNHPEMNEGAMTRTRSTLVQSISLANKAKEYHYDDFIRAGHSLNQDEALHNQHILEDVFEAVLGAIYIDQGINFVSQYIINMFENDVINFTPSEVKDYKSILQEAMQAEYRESVAYKTISEKGPPHNRIFTVEVTFNGQVLGHGVGKSKKEAERKAAQDALSKVAK